LFTQLSELRRRQQQQVLQKPNLNLSNSDQGFQKSVSQNPDSKVKVASLNPILQSGEDITVKDERNFVKAVTNVDEMSC